MKHVFALAFLLFSFFGCATIVGDKESTLVVSSEPDEAAFIIRDENGVAVSKGTTPASVRLRKKAGYLSGKTYTVEFWKDGYGRQLVTVDTEASAWYLFGNLLFGGLIGWFIVDPVSGAMWELEPEVAHVVLFKVDESDT